METWTHFPGRSWLRSDNHSPVYCRDHRYHHCCQNQESKSTCRARHCTCRGCCTARLPWYLVPMLLQAFVTATTQTMQQENMSTMRADIAYSNSNEGRQIIQPQHTTTTIILSAGSTVNNSNERRYTACDNNGHQATATTAVNDS